MSEQMSRLYKFQIASDVVRDGLGVELLDESGNVLAEVFRGDKDKTVVLNTFNNDVPIESITALLEIAKERLDPFEDNTPISSIWK